MVAEAVVLILWVVMMMFAIVAVVVSMSITVLTKQTQDVVCDGLESTLNGCSLDVCAYRDNQGDDDDYLHCL